MSRIRFRIGDIELDAELNQSATAKAVEQALPFESRGSYWGQEFYFETPVEASQAPDATDVLEPGTLAYWPPGQALCLFWGPTPASRGEECRAASPVNIVGRVLEPERLRQLRARKVEVLRVETTAAR